VESMGNIVLIIISLLIYGVMAALTKEGRCSRHEYIVTIETGKIIPVYYF